MFENHYHSLWGSNMGFKSYIIGFIIWHFKTQDLTFKPMFIQNCVCHVHNKSTNKGLEISIMGFEFKHKF